MRKLLDKRRLLMGAALMAAGASLGATGSCSTTPSAPSTLPPGTIDAINKEVATVCNGAVVMAASTIVAVVLAQFPELALLAALTPEMTKQVATFICGLIPPLKTAAGKNMDKVEGPVTAVLNGQTIEVHGWRLVDGKQVWF